MASDWPKHPIYGGENDPVGPQLRNSYLCLFEHNGLRPHRALREAQEGLPEGRRYRPRTPAMAIGLTDHIWTWEEFLTFPHHQYLMG